MQLIIKIRLYGKFYTVCYISEDELLLPKPIFYKLLGLKVENDSKDDLFSIVQLEKTLRLKTSALFLYPFVHECYNSKVYRIKVLVHLYQLSQKKEDDIVFLKLLLEPPDKEILDYAWNERILKLIWTRIEIENAFSWLSTLGGAYSALGDYFEHCAEEAGRISLRQFKLSRMLGDESLAARSRLYSALSHAQKGKLKTARHIVRYVASYARKSRDRRLLRMCQGVWAKLKYLRSIRHSYKSSEIHEIGKEGQVIH